MRIPVAISGTVTGVIAVCLALVGWNDKQHLMASRDRHARLARQAAAIGLAVNPSDPVRVLSSCGGTRESAVAAAKRLESDYIAFGKEWEATLLGGVPANVEFQRLMADLRRRVGSLNTEQAESLLTEVLGANELADPTRSALVIFAIRGYSKKNGAGTVMLLTRLSDRFQDTRLLENLMAESLGSWAGEDSGAALAWYRSNAASGPALSCENVKREMIVGVAKSDKKLAFRLMDEFGIEDVGWAIGNMNMNVLGSAADRAEWFAAYREYLACRINAESRSKVIDAGKRVLNGAAQQDGFGVVAKWLEESGLSSGEIARITNGLQPASATDADQWFDWFQKTLPPESAADNTRKSVECWAEHDFKAATEWLAIQTDATVRDTAITTIAVTGARRFPRTAIEWAQGLPDGEHRMLALQAIYNALPKVDPADKEAAEAFADEHGIK